ncbi:MAG TPA: nicotinate-nucleotide adenylyltransferase [Chroococcales cyanobacterium]
MKRLGLMCGTFNPIHLGHLLIAECARDQFGLDKVLFITSPEPPHRQGEKGLLPAAERHLMVQAAIADNQNFEGSDVELKRSGPSYTIDTIEHFLLQYGPSVELFLILGGDNTAELAGWHRAEDIFAKCTILVAPRLVSDCPIGKNQENPEIPERYVRATVNKGAATSARVEVIDFPAVSISASSVRNRLKENRSVLYMVPKAVNDLLLANGYYREENQ